MKYKVEGREILAFDESLDVWRKIFEAPDRIEKWRLVPDKGIVITTDAKTDRRNIFLIGFDGRLKWQIAPAPRLQDFSSPNLNDTVPDSSWT